MKGTIVIVDDDEDSAEALRDILRLRGYGAHAVTSGQACLDYLAIHSADVVLTDLTMPGMSGLSLCATLRDRYPDLMSIVLTGHEDFDSAAVGVYAFITKPILIDAVEVVVTRALDHVRGRAAPL